jgi:hypothetical protein
LLREALPRGPVRVLKIKTAAAEAINRCLSMNINAMFAGMNLRSWSFHPVQIILSALNAKVRILASFCLHSVQELHLPILFLPLHHPEVAVVPVFHEANNFFRSEE